jgi:predicted RNase H-like nuclease (RuvC/YqgF family)
MRTIENQSESLWENFGNGKPENSYTIWEALQSISAKIGDDFTHLNNNNRELEHAFQQLQTQNQSLREELKQMHNLNNELHSEYEYHLQNVYAPLRDKAQNLEHLLENLKTMMATAEKKVDVHLKKDGEQKYYTIIEYYRLKNVKFTESKLQNLHVLLQKKSKEVGYEAKKINIHGREEWGYHSYVLRIILCF